MTASQRPHPIVCVAIAVERDLHAAETKRQQPIDDVGREEQSVRDDVDHHADAARLTRVPQPLGDRHRAGEVRVGQEHDELVTARARDDVDLAAGGHD